MVFAVRVIDTREWRVVGGGGGIVNTIVITYCATTRETNHAFTRPDSILSLPFQRPKYIRCRFYVFRALNNIRVMFMRMRESVVVIGYASVTCPIDRLRTRPVPSRPVPSRPVPSRPVPSRPVPSRPVPSRPVPSRPVPSRPVPSRLLVLMMQELDVLCELQYF